MMAVLENKPSVWPVRFQSILEAERRIRRYIPMTPLRSYPALNAVAGAGMQIFVKHENCNPTNSFKARNGLAFITALKPEDRKRGVVTASRGNHGQGLAWAGSLFKVPVAICVPVENNPCKNQAILGWGAELIERGADYDDAIGVAKQIAESRKMILAHATNNPHVIAGAGTLTLEILRQMSEIDALVLPVGGGSQIVGAMTVMRTLKPSVPVYGVQAENASTLYASWKAGRPVYRTAKNTLADGLATRYLYEYTFPALCEGLAGFVTVSEAEIAEAIRLFLSRTHHLAEGAGAAGLAGVLKLKKELSGKKVAIVLSGSNIDFPTLKKVLNGEV